MPGEVWFLLLLQTEFQFLHSQLHLPILTAIGAKDFRLTYCKPNGIILERIHTSVSINLEVNFSIPTGLEEEELLLPQLIMYNFKLKNYDT